MAYYYKMQAPCSSASSGYVTWVNRTGDDTNRPACAAGTNPATIVDRWPSYDQSKGPIIEDNVTTTWNNTTTKQVDLYAMPDECEVAITFWATAAKQGAVTKAALLRGTATYRRTGGGAPTLVGTPDYPTDMETDAGYAALFSPNGNTLGVTIANGDATTNNWDVSYRIQQTNA